MSSAAPADAKAAKAKTITMDLYVMSLCPFGVQAENAIIPAVKSLAGRVDLKIHFIAAEVSPSTHTQNAKPAAAFQSLHGQPEVDENIRQLCARQYYPKLYLDYILERNKDYKSAAWRGAAHQAGLDADKIDVCANGEEGAALLRENIKAAVKRNTTRSPTIDIDGKPYKGPRGLKSVTLAACQALKENGIALPKGCKKAEAMPPEPAPGGPASDTCGDNAGHPAAPPFDIRVVADNSCPVCSPTLFDTLKNLHPNAVIKIIDMGSEEGKALILEHQVRSLPLYVLDNKVQNDPNFLILIDSFYAKSGDSYIVRPGTNTYVPSVQLSRERVPRHLDIFVEATSPAAVQAEAEFVNFLEQTKAKDFTFSFHYVVQEGVKAETTSSTISTSSRKIRAASGEELSSTLPGPIVSRLGENDVHESIRQICLFQKASIGAFFSYLACRSQSPADQALTDKCLVLDESIKTCIDGGEGEKLLRQDAALVRELGIPTGVSILWENRFGPFEWTEIDWRKLFEN